MYNFQIDDIYSILRRTYVSTYLILVMHGCMSAQDRSLTYSTLIVHILV